MKNALVKSKSSSLKLSNSRREESVKLVVFALGKVNLALPIETVSKVLNQTPVYGSGLNGVGIAHVNDREVTVVDLHQRLFQSSLLTDAAKNNYLMVVKNQHSELYGIPVTTVPVLMEVPLSSIRILPESYRQADIFGFATHVAVINDVEPAMTIFMLDIEQMLAVR